MMDVETRARRAGEAARIEAAARARHLALPTAASGSPRDRRVAGRPLLAALGTACLVLVVVAVVGQLTRPATPTIEAAVPDLADLVAEPVAEDGVLPVPPVGEAIPAYLADGTPVFVSHPVDGDVRVIGARNPHEWGWQGKLVTWCPSSGWFEDAYHGSRFNAWGDYTGGPAPFALPDHVAELADDGRTVRVTGEVIATRSRTDRRAQQPQRGPNCTDGSDDADEPSAAVGHVTPEDLPLLDGTAIPTDRWVWAVIRTGGAPGDPRACDADGPCSQESPRLAGLAGIEGDDITDGGTTGGLVRHTDEGVVVLRPGLPAWDASPEGDSGRALPAAPRLLPLPEPGEVLAEWYGSARHPVFVARDEEGGVHVLDAASPAQESSLVGWCATSGAFLDDTGVRWGPAGDGVGGGAWTDLGRYPAEIVTRGELQSVRVTGELELEWSWTGSGLVGPATIGPDCATHELVRHLPGERTHVLEHGRLAWSGSEPTWRWVRMEVALVDGEVLLCAVEGPQDCGDPGAQPDPTNADCIDDIGPAGLCPPDEDPVVVSAGVGPTDGPTLLLVRASPDGRTVEVRHPAATS